MLVADREERPVLARDPHEGLVDPHDLEVGAGLRLIEAVEALFAGPADRRHVPFAAFDRLLENILRDRQPRTDRRVLLLLDLFDLHRPLDDDEGGRLNGVGPIRCRIDDHVFRGHQRHVGPVEGELIDVARAAARGSFAVALAEFLLPGLLRDANAGQHRVLARAHRCQEPRERGFARRSRGPVIDDLFHDRGRAALLGIAIVARQARHRVDIVEQRGGDRGQVFAHRRARLWHEQPRSASPIWLGVFAPNVVFLVKCAERLRPCLAVDLGDVKKRLILGLADKLQEVDAALVGLGLDAGVLSVLLGRVLKLLFAPAHGAVFARRRSLGVQRHRDGAATARVVFAWGRSAQH